MQIKVHVNFRPENAPLLFQFLNANNIPYHTGEIGICDFDLLNSNPFWEPIKLLVQKYDCFATYETLYNKEEVSNAEWFRVRSQWKSGYPQPEGKFGYENITYTRQSHCDSCGCGLLQVDSFRMKKAPKWGRRHFMELNWIGDELFVDDTIRSVLETNQVSGISFFDVYDKKGQEKLDGIHQIFISTLLGKGMIEDSTAFKDIEQCQRCGEKKFVYSGIGMLSFKREIFEGVSDVVKISEYFGSGHYAQRMILVNQKVHQLITSNKLDAGLIFEPINLV